MKTKRKRTDWTLLFQLFLSFLKIGPVTFGGGYAMIPLIEREVVERRQWVKMEDVSTVFALAESVPGAIAINSATFIGYRIAGVLGAISAMIGIMLPTFLIVLGLGIFVYFVKDHPTVIAAFAGIRPAIVALIVYAGFQIGKTAVLDKTTFALVGISAATLLFLPVHPVVVIVGGAFIGMIIIKLKDTFGITTK